MSSTTEDILKISILGKEAIHCGFHLIPYIVRTVLATLPSSTYVLFTDTHVAQFYLQAFEEEFHRVLSARANGVIAAPRFLTRVIPPGETSKSREGKAELEDFLLFNKCTRDTVILAFGGGRHWGSSRFCGSYLVSLFLFSTLCLTPIFAVCVASALFRFLPPY